MAAVIQYGLEMALIWQKFHLITDMASQIMDTMNTKIICPWTTMYTMTKNCKLLKIGFLQKLKPSVHIIWTRSCGIFQR